MSDEANRKQLTQFLLDKVIGDEFELVDLENLRTYVTDRKDREAALCDWLELGNWFYEAMTACDFDAREFIDELEEKLSAAYRTSAQHEAEQRADYLQMVGAR